MSGIDTRFAHIPVPADALDTPSEWIEWDEGLHARGYTAWRGRAAGFEVVIDCWQFSTDRPTEREIVFTDTNRGRDLTAARARAVGVLLVEAADALDRLSAGEGTVRMSSPEPTAVDAAAANCREHLLAARADAALWATVAGLGTAAADDPMWLATAIEAVLVDLDRMTGADSTDWHID